MLPEFARTGTIVTVDPHQSVVRLQWCAQEHSRCPVERWRRQALFLVKLPMLKDTRVEAAFDNLFYIW